MCEKTVSKKRRHSVVIAPKKPWVFRGIIRTLFISTVFFYENWCFPHWFLFCFSLVTLWSLVTTSTNGLFSRVNFTKMYRISTKNKNVTCVIVWFFIILFSFPLPFIYTSFMFAGSCNFAAAENLKCVRQQGLNLYKASQISHFIHHSKGNIILFQNICCKSILKDCHWIKSRLEFKKVRSSAQKFLGNLNNILGAGR